LQLARLDAGSATPAMSDAYVRRLFDQYAGRYDTALTERLAYRGPALLREAVQAAMRKAGRPFHFANLLDLGCGTGLAAAAFRPLADRITGVDLSPAMLAQAQSKNLYDRLVTADIGDFLVAEAASGATYDLVLAADVLVYVNNLAPIATAVARVVSPAGLFAFTVETHTGEGVKLLPTLRYAYAEDYIRRTLTAAGLQPASVSSAAVRREKGVPVAGLVVVAKAPSAGQA
jgi:predicted TPR repeat methyltransferase